MRNTYSIDDTMTCNCRAASTSSYKEFFYNYQSIFSLTLLPIGVFIKVFLHNSKKATDGLEGGTSEGGGQELCHPYDPLCRGTNEYYEAQFMLTNSINRFFLKRFMEIINEGTSNLKPDDSGVSVLLCLLLDVTKLYAILRRYLFWHTLQWLTTDLLNLI